MSPTAATLLPGLPIQTVICNATHLKQLIHIKPNIKVCQDLVQLLEKIWGGRKKRERKNKYSRFGLVSFRAPHLPPIIDPIPDSLQMLPLLKALLVSDLSGSPERMQKLL